MSKKVIKIITNLLTTEPTYVNVTPSPYNAWETYEKKVTRILLCLRRATYLGQWTETLIMAYYLDQLVEETGPWNCLTLYYCLE
ncbi:297_t:CDS:1, partial [Acaulospora morrowiae]